MTHASGLHGVLMSLLPVLLAGWSGASRDSTCLTPLTCPVRRRCAALEQKLAAGSLLGALRYGMQPCTPPRQSTCWVNGHGVLPSPVDTATTRSSSTANSRHHNRRMSAPVFRTSMREAEVSRWITAEFTCTQPVLDTTRGVRQHPSDGRLRGYWSCAIAEWRHVRDVWSTPRANRRGCRSAIR